MMTTSRFALRFKMESASSRDQLASGAQEDFINAIRKDASVQSHITFARILTDMRGRHLQFHQVHHLFLWSFAGRGAFSRAALQAGLRVVSVDHEVVQPFAPIVNLDLTTESGSRILWDILNAPGVAAVHLRLPCGTSSRARELPIPEAMKRAGVPEPPPLRSAEHPLGLPGLADHHWKRVNSANLLYRLAIEIVLWCHEHDVVLKTLPTVGFGRHWWHLRGNTQLQLPLLWANYRWSSFTLVVTAPQDESIQDGFRLLVFLMR